MAEFVALFRTSLRGDNIILSNVSAKLSFTKGWIFCLVFNPVLELIFKYCVTPGHILVEDQNSCIILEADFIGITPVFNSIFHRYLGRTIINTAGRALCLTLLCCFTIVGSYNLIVFLAKQSLVHQLIMTHIDFSRHTSDS